MKASWNHNFVNNFLASYYRYIKNWDVSLYKGNFIPILLNSISQLLYSFPGKSFIISTAFHQIFASVEEFYLTKKSNPTESF